MAKKVHAHKGMEFHRTSKKPGCREIDLQVMRWEQDSKNSIASEKAVKVNQGKGNRGFQGTLKLFKFIRIMEI